MGLKTLPYLVYTAISAVMVMSVISGGFWYLFSGLIIGAASMLITGYILGKRRSDEL